MADTSNQRPAEGYFLPLFPPSFFPDPVNAGQVFGALDLSPERARASIDALRDAHRLRTAVGADLDDLVSLLGLKRLEGETDLQLRVRAPATARHGLSASTVPDMATYLTAALGLPVVVTDESAGSVSFRVTVNGNNGLLGSVPGLIRAVKAAGTVFHAYAVIPASDGGGAGLGEFGLGEQVVGGSDGLVFLGS